ncbi:hypothetical protein JL722_12427 [Aureococcus anophagefferens]|nr:hypothetical protein JL722_12427 [Aureococcus anophagefferens]
MNKVLVALALFAPAFAADECAVTEVDVHSTEGSADRGSLELDEANPCIDAALGYAPLRDDLANVPCDDAGAQSATDVTVGAVGEMDPGLDPIEDYNAMGMCTVNIHWHIGAEHRSEGVYDETFDFDHPALHDDDAHRKLAWTNGKQRPNGRRKLAGGRTKWQYQYHFLDGVLCGATQGNVDIATASALLSDRTHGIGVEGQVYTIGSTTGDAADNEICRGTGGLVTWHQDRQCHLLEASTMDNICRQMLVISADDMSPDVAPHGARETVSASLSDTPYTP